MIEGIWTGYLLLSLVALFYVLWELFKSFQDGGIARSRFLAILAVTAITGLCFSIQQLTSASTLGIPAGFGQIEKGGAMYEMGAEAGEKGTLWIKSREGESRIFKDVPVKLQKNGTKFILKDGRIMVIKDEFKSETKKE